MTCTVVLVLCNVAVYVVTISKRAPVYESQGKPPLTATIQVACGGGKESGCSKPDAHFLNMQTATNRR